MNILCDHAANTLGGTVPDHMIPISVVSDMWTIKIGGTSLTHEIDLQICRWVHDPNLREYWRLNGQTTEASEHLYNTNTTITVELFGKTRIQEKNSERTTQRSSSPSN